MDVTSYVEVSSEKITAAMEACIKNIIDKRKRNRENFKKNLIGKRKFWFGPKRTEEEAERYIEKLEKESSLEASEWIIKYGLQEMNARDLIIAAKQNDKMLLSKEDAYLVNQWSDE